MFCNPLLDSWTKFQISHPTVDSDQLEKYIFQMWDIDGDGAIDYKEFMTVFYVLTSDKVEDRLKMIFKIYDPAYSWVTRAWHWAIWGFRHVNLSFASHLKEASSVVPWRMSNYLHAHVQKIDYYEQHVFKSFQQSKWNILNTKYFNWLTYVLKYI